MFLKIALFCSICLSALPAQAGVAQAGGFSFKVITDFGIC